MPELTISQASQFEFRFRHADLFARFTFAHRARCAAAIRLRPAADIVRLLGSVRTFDFGLFAFSFAHLAL
jgi:hypothetical protein